MDALTRARLPLRPAARLLRCAGVAERSGQTHIRSSGLPSASCWPAPPAAGSLQLRLPRLSDPCQAQRRAFTQKAAAGGDKSSFLGIFGDKEEQIARKNSNVDQVGIWPRLPDHIRKSLRDPSRGEFICWLGHGVTKGKAAIIRLVTDEEAAAVISCMGTDEDRPGVMGAESVAELYVGRVNTARHLIADKTLAECFFQRVRHCRVTEDRANGEEALLASMQFGPEVVGVNEKIRLVTTKEGGEHQKHADISERSDDGSCVSRLTFQCYLNPERYEGGHFQLYPEGNEVPVDIPVRTGSAVVFVQEDAELMHGGGRILGGEAKRAIRGNLDVLAPA